MALQSSFGTVLWIVCGIGIVLAFVALAGSGKAWSEYGKHRLLMDSELPPGPRSGAAGRTATGGRGGATDTVERDEEIRQMLEARNARRARRGEAPVDVEAELARLVAPAIDDALRAEIRELVVARNFRRARHGEAPLDVEAEVARQVAALSPGTSG